MAARMSCPLAVWCSMNPLLVSLSLIGALNSFTRAATSATAVKAESFISIFSHNDEDSRNSLWELC